MRAGVRRFRLRTDRQSVVANLWHLYPQLAPRLLLRHRQRPFAARAQRLWWRQLHRHHAGCERVPVLQPVHQCCAGQSGAGPDQSGLCSGERELAGSDRLPLPAEWYACDRRAVYRRCGVQRRFRGVRAEAGLCLRRPVPADQFRDRSAQPVQRSRSVSMCDRWRPLVPRRSERHQLPGRRVHLPRPVSRCAPVAGCLRPVCRGADGGVRRVRADRRGPVRGLRRAGGLDRQSQALGPLAGDRFPRPARVCGRYVPRAAPGRSGHRRGSRGGGDQRARWQLQGDRHRGQSRARARNRADL